MGDPFSTNDRRGGWVVVPITMKKYLGEGGWPILYILFHLKLKKGLLSHLMKLIGRAGN